MYDAGQDRLFAVTREYSGGLFGYFQLGVWVLSSDPTPHWQRYGQAGGTGNYGYALVLDTRRDRLVLYGGAYETRSGSIYATSTLIAFDLATEGGWYELVAAGGGPGDRAGVVAAYDAARDRMIVCCGARISAYDYTSLNDAWALSFADTSRWDSLAVAGGPPSPRFDAQSAWSPAAGRMLIYGGTERYPRVPDIEHFDVVGLDVDGAAAVTWNAVNAESPEHARAPSTVFDTRRGRLLLLGGSIPSAVGITELCDAWALTDTALAAWTPFGVASASPDFIDGSHAFWSTGTAQAFFLFGSLDGHASQAGWVYDASSGAWRSFALPGTGGTGPVAYDVRRQRLVVLLWDSNAGRLTLDATDLSAPGTWTEIPMSGTPVTVSELFSIVYDPALDRIVVLGADNVRTVSLAATPAAWSDPLFPAIHPSPNSARLTAPMLDRIGRRIIVIDPSVTPFTAWSLSVDSLNWSAIALPASGPSHITAAAVDPDRHRLVVLAPDDWNDPRIDETWFIDLDAPLAWNRIATTPPAPPRSGPALLVDRAGGRLVMLGGARNDVWALPLDALTPTLPSFSRFDARPDRVELHWQGAEAIARSAVERRTATGAWIAVGQAERDAPDDLAFVDRDVVPGAAYSYRLVVTRDGVASRTPEITVWVPSRAGTLELRVLGPNPARDRARLAIALPGSRPARLDLYDTSGRRVFEQALSPVAGAASFEWAAPRRLPAGLYFLRLSQANASIVRRIVFAR